MGTESEDDFNQLFEDLDLNSTKLGRTVEARNTLIAKVLSHLDKIDFALEIQTCAPGLKPVWLRGFILGCDIGVGTFCPYNCVYCLLFRLRMVESFN